MATPAKPQRSRTGPIHLARSAEVRYVYAIELNPSVWAKAKFRAENRRAAARFDRGEAVVAVYVGSSAHTGACRFAIHRGAATCCCGLTRTGDVKAGTGSDSRPAGSPPAAKR